MIGDDPLALVNLRPLMHRTSGHPDIAVGLLDGPVSADPLASDNVRALVDDPPDCSQREGPASDHGTFVASIISASRSAKIPGICPDCTLLVRPIFTDESLRTGGQGPRATSQELAEALVDSATHGVRVVNLSAAITSGGSKKDRELRQALDEAMKWGMLVVAAAGNQGAVGSSVVTGHPWVIPVVACGSQGRPLGLSNLGASIGRRGLAAPGEGIAGLAADGREVEWTGTSAATPFVVGALALVWSEVPAASAAMIRYAVSKLPPSPRSVVPPLLDAWGCYARVRAMTRRE